MSDTKYSDALLANGRLRAERDRLLEALTSANETIVKLAQTFSTGNDSLREALTTVVVVYKRDNPLRTADQHSPSCTCMRCAIDAADAAMAKEAG